MTVFRRIEAVGYRCLREVSQELSPFQILVGPNGSGKSAFFDVIHFLSDFTQDGLDAAIQKRSPTFQDLLWRRTGSTFRFMIELAIPKSNINQGGGIQSALRYTFSARLNEEAGRVEVAEESETLWPEEGKELPRPLMVRSGARVLADDKPGQWSSRVPADRSSLLMSPANMAFMNTRAVVLDPKALAAPNPPERGNDRINNGASLAWQVRLLQERHPEKLAAWISHVRTALPDVCKIESILQEWDNRRFVRVQYDNGLQIPAWMLSEGTLRLLALTILAYIPNFQGLYMIEEPENGVHPAALETIYQSLSSTYQAQVLLSTHSPVLLSMAKPEQILCFSKTPEGTKITRGDQHPALREWQGEVSLGTMVASGILD